MSDESEVMEVTVVAEEPKHLTGKQLREAERLQVSIKIQMAHDQLMETNRTCRIMNLIRTRLAERRGKAQVAKNLDEVLRIKERSALVAMANRRLQLLIRLNMFKATEEDVEEGDTLIRKLDAMGFDEGTFFEQCIADGLLTQLEMQNIVDGMDADGSHLGRGK